MSSVKSSISIDGSHVVTDKFTPTEELSSPAWTALKSPVFNEKFKKESSRKETFANWPLQTRIDGAKLAKAGFIYTGHEDEVVCVFCDGHVKGWMYADSAMRKHRERYPLCDFVSGKSNNIPLNASPGYASWNSVGEREQPNQNGFSETRFCNQPSASHDVHNSHEDVPPNQNHISSNNTELIDFEKLKSGEERIKTFVGWPANSVNPDELVRAGFFSLNDGDKVQCAYCEGIVSKWDTEDNPMEEHCKHFPRCPFIMNMLPSLSSEQNLWHKRNGHDVCGKYNIWNSLPENGLNHGNLEDLGVSIHSGPVHREQATESTRLRSFVSWPSNAPVKKEDLAKAGFFYIGISDHTKCFYCDGGLSKWDPGDDPWVEHARWFPKCNFLRLTKGDEFVTACSQQIKEHKHSEMNGSTTRASFDDTTLNQKADEIMQSSMVTSVFEAGLYPPYLVRAAVIRQIKETGGTFTNLDELCEAISSIQNEISSETSNTSNAVSNHSEELPKKLSITLRTEHNKDPVPTKPLLARGGPSTGINGLTNVAQSGYSVEHSTSEEYQALKDQRLCKICMDNEVGIVFLPCGHLLTCTSCATALKDCPLCRTTIRGSVRVFMP